MKVIGFDTATDDTVVGARDGGEQIWEFTAGPDSSGRPVHSTELLGAVCEAAKRLGGWGAIDRIAVGTGPGTFTGLRVGLASALGLAEGTGTTLVGISTLQALSLARQPATGEASAPILDARRGEVFFGAWGPDGEELLAPAVGSPVGAVEALLGLPVKPLAFGPGAIRFEEEFREAGLESTLTDGREEVLHLSGGSICWLGEQGEALGPGSMPEPRYIRQPDAELWLKRDSRE